MASLRSLPQVDRLSRSKCLDPFPGEVRVKAARSVVDRARANPGTVADQVDWEGLALLEAKKLCKRHLGPAINATGVLLHTGLGRARLARTALRSVVEAGSGYCLLEVDPESGKRGDRVSRVNQLLCELTGAEDALVVNNGAAAVLLALAALASDGETLLSRGQMVEIGGSFRLPEIVKCSGSRLVEVGCTNRTRLKDFEGALSQHTRAVLRCHPSNFKIVGFVEEPTAQELAAFCDVHALSLIDDVGSGCLVDLARWGLPHERTLQEAIRDGATIVTASGDKLLGGPQAGIILGRREAVRLLKNHPMARAMRIDKLCLAALESTLMLYRGTELEIPVLSALSRPLASVRRAARRIARAAGPSAVVELGLTAIGGGSAPGEGVRTYRVGIESEDLDALAQKLRQSDPPIFGRIEGGRLWLDPRPLEASEVAHIVKALKEIA